MAIFTMSDLHLSLDTDKSMEVFGSRWDDYINRIRDNWTGIVSDGDTVLVGGDISWEMHLKDCVKDFAFIDSLPGSKILFKGNHDYWWESMTKLNGFVDANGFHSISFSHNKAFICEDVLITGTRLWNLPGDGGFGEDDAAVYKRELIRLELSLVEGTKLCEKQGFVPGKIVCVLHYPPFTKSHIFDEAAVDIMNRYGVTDCVYGHLHSYPPGTMPDEVHRGIKFRLVSADYLRFSPVKL